MSDFTSDLSFENEIPALGIAAKSPQRGTSEDLQRKARPAG
jgi:hypothetical protein